jgi:glutathione peroxidase-family protein
MEKMKSLWLRILVVSVVVSSLIGCSNESEEYKAYISGCLTGYAGESISLEVDEKSGRNVVASTTIDESGRYSFEVENESAAPVLYYLTCDRYSVPLIVSPDESIEVNSEGDILKNYTVSGSHESELLRTFNKEYIELRAELMAILADLEGADADTQEQLMKRYQAVYNELKRNQISFIIENKATLAALCVLYQRLPNEQYLSGKEISDAIHYRMVLDAVLPEYSEAKLVKKLKQDVEQMEARIAVLQSIEERSYPELKANDVYGKEQALSSLEGNVILVDFWSAEAGNSNAFNADLRALYKKYESQGFRVYQVSADTSKAKWLAAVLEQHLPWVSVCDLKGTASPLFHAYNVTKLPSNFLIDREGNIVAKNLYGETLEKELAKMFK